MSPNNVKGASKCSFCSKPKEWVKMLIAGPGVFICNECVELVTEVLQEDEALPEERRFKSAEKCSFCNKTRDDGLRIIAERGVNICSECVELCNEMLAEEGASKDAATKAGSPEKNSVTSETEKHFGESCSLREDFWTEIGNVDPDVVAHLINPAFMGGPPWPSLRQAFITVRTDKSTILASDGLSDPFDTPDNAPSEFKNPETCNGFGLEFYVESPGRLHPIIGSWELAMLWQMSQNAAFTGNIGSLLKKHQYITMELYDVNVPKEFQHEGGRVGVLLGLQSKAIPKQMKLSLETIDVVNIKLLNSKELQYVIKFGQNGRDKLAEFFMNQADTAMSYLSRPSFV